jgi:Zinc carboxypeptidase
VGLEFLRGFCVLSNVEEILPLWFFGGCPTPECVRKTQNAKRKTQNYLLLLLFVSILVWAFTCRGEGQIRTPDLPASSRAFDFYERGPYRPELPRPSEFLGYEAGDFLTTFALYESLLRQYQQHSDRLRVFTIGRTPEHRPLYLLAISSPDNLARLDSIKEQLGRLADPRKLKAGPELDQVIGKLPIVIWLSYSIHGDESAAFEAGIQVLYQLLASNDPALGEALDHTLVLINPCQNPDGHERFATWYNAHGIGRPERYAYEHQEPWSVSGRLNHNFFDLNRDLVALSQPESQAATQAFLQWHPQILADHHGQTREYFFPPPALPINPNLPEKATIKWLDIFGKANAEAFDGYAWPYFVRERFDLFYPGYWDSWSSLHGATGMTYETDGGGTLGYQWYRDDGTVLTLRSAIAKHFTADLATVQVAAVNREARLRDYRDFFETSLDGLRRKYFLLPGKDPQSTAGFISVLLKQGIEVSRINADVKLLQGRDYFGHDPGEKTMPAGSFLVDTAQPYGRIASALLEIETPQDLEFLKRQEELRKQNDAKGPEEAKRDYEFYDVTAWSLPLAMGVEAYFTDEPIRANFTPVISAAYPRMTLRTEKGDQEAGFTAGQIGPGVAYAFEPSSVAAMRVALSLLGQGYRIETSNDEFYAAGKDFPRGSFILRDERNPANLRQILMELADKDGVAVRSIRSAFPDNSRRGIGSEAIYALKTPKIAVLADEPVTPTSYGLVRFILEHECGANPVPVALENLTTDVLGHEEVNVLILPDGDASHYKKMFGDEQVDQLRDWVSRGGVLVCIGGASEFAADPDIKLTSSRVIGSDEKGNASPDKTPAETRPKAVREPPAKKDAANRKPMEVPGAIVRAKINRNHFLTIGYDFDTLPFFVQGDAFFKPSETGANVLTFDGEGLKLSGFFWEGNTEELLRGSSALIDEPIEAGHVILFSSEPGFRMIWTSTIRLLLNAIVYGPSQPRQEGE